MHGRRPQRHGCTRAQKRLGQGYGSTTNERCIPTYLCAPARWMLRCAAFRRLLRSRRSSRLRTCALPLACPRRRQRTRPWRRCWRCELELETFTCPVCVLLRRGPTPVPRQHAQIDSKQLLLARGSVGEAAHRAPSGFEKPLRLLSCPMTAPPDGSSADACQQQIVPRCRHVSGAGPLWVCVGFSKDSLSALAAGGTGEQTNQGQSCALRQGGQTPGQAIGWLTINRHLQPARPHPCHSRRCNVCIGCH